MLMENKLLNKYACFITLTKCLLLFTMLFCFGCSPSQQSPYEFKELPPVETTDKFSLALQAESLPVEADPLSPISVNDLPDNSIYLSVAVPSQNSTAFQINVNVKNLSGVYDIPLTLRFNPNLISIGDSGSQNGPILGSVFTSKSNIINGNISIAGENDQQTSGDYFVSINLYKYIGENQNFSGTIASFFCQSLTPTLYDSPLGFVIDHSKILDKDGNFLSVNFYGGTLSQKR